jgi:hypothetical protein
MSTIDVGLQVTESDLFKATGDFLSVLFPDAEITQTQQNQTPMPKGGFITMTPLFLTDLSTSAVNYEYDGVSDYGRAELRRVDEWQCQLDFYGDQAQNNATIFSRIARSNSHAPGSGKTRMSWCRFIPAPAANLDDQRRETVGIPLDA